MDNLKTRVALTRAAAGLAVAAMGVAGPLIGGAAASSTTSTPPGTTTSPLATSAAPKEVVIDPTTGSVQSVTPLSSAAYQALLAIANADSDNSASTSNFSPDISNHNVCDSGNACYYTNVVPYADQGFYGSAGIYDGSWPDRDAFDTGNYTGNACWSSHCTGNWGPNTYISLTSDVTGTSVYIN